MSGSERDIRILQHILGYCRQIDATLERFGDDSTVFLGDVIYQNAVSMCLLQIGELVGHLSEEYRSAHPQMPWRQMRALRNIIARNYGSVDSDTAWEIVKEDIPMLRAYCERETRQGAEMWADLCETVHDLAELYLSKEGPKGVAALEFNLSAVENSIANTAKCMQGSLAEEYKNRALKLIKDLKGKNNEEIYTGIEDREETLHKLFGMRQSPAMAQ